MWFDWKLICLVTGVSISTVSDREIVASEHFCYCSVFLCVARLIWKQISNNNKNNCDHWFNNSCAPLLTCWQPIPFGVVPFFSLTLSCEYCVIRTLHANYSVLLILVWVKISSACARGFFPVAATVWPAVPILVPDQTLKKEKKEKTNERERTTINFHTQRNEQWITACIHCEIAHVVRIFLVFMTHPK